MIRRALTTLAVIVSLVLPSLSHAESADLSNLELLRDEWVEALNDGDLVEVLQGFAPGATLYLDMLEPMRSRGAIAAWYRHVLNHGRSSFEFRSQGVEIEGDWAFERWEARVAVSIPGDEGSWSAEVRFEDTGTRVYRRTADGSWKIDREVWNGEHRGADRLAALLAPVLLEVTEQAAAKGWGGIREARRSSASRTPYGRWPESPSP